METTEVISSQTDALKEALRMSKREWHLADHIYVIREDNGYVISVMKSWAKLPCVAKYHRGIKTTWANE